MAYISNAQVVRAFKLIEGIDSGHTKEYNPTKVFVDAKVSDNSKINSQMVLIPIQQSTSEIVTDPGSARRIKIGINDNNALDNL